jgi:hypothetical protein
VVVPQVTTWYTRKKSKSVSKPCFASHYIEWLEKELTILLINNIICLFPPFYSQVFPYNRKKTNVVHDMLNKYVFSTFQENNLEINRNKKPKIYLIYL